MRVLTREENQYTKKTASFSVYYDSVKDNFLKRDWNKLKNKQDTVNVFFQNGLTVFEAFKQIRLIIKK
jgi:hypothetical protein